jgi:hypothetical protein
MSIFDSMRLGESASATNEGRQKWRELWLKQESNETQKDLVDVQRTQVDVDRERVINDGRRIGLEESKDRYQRHKDAYDNAMTMLPNMTFDEALQFVEDFEDTNPFKSQLRAGVYSQTINADPTQASNYLNNILNLPVGQTFLLPAAIDSARALGRRMGWSDETIVEMVETLEEWHAHLGGEQEFTRRNEMERMVADLANVRASTDNIYAETDKTRAFTAGIIQDTSFKADEHPEVMRQLRAVSSRMEHEEVIAAAQAGQIDERLAAELNVLLAQLSLAEVDVQIAERTIRAVVNRITAESEIVEEEARHLVATGLVRDAIVQGNLDHLETSISFLEEQTEGQRLANSLTEVEVERAGLALDTQTYSLLATMVERGDAAVIRATAGRLLGILNVPEDLVDGIVESMATEAGQTGDRRVRMARFAEEIARADSLVARRTINARVRTANAGARNADAEADLNRWLADSAQDRHDTAVRLQERGLDIEERKLTQMIRNAASGAGTTTSEFTLTSAWSKANTLTGWDSRRFQEQVGELLELDAHIDALQAAMRPGGGGSVLVLEQLAAQGYPGIDITDPVGSYNYLVNRLNGSRQILTNNATAFITAFLSHGQIPEAHMIGMLGNEREWVEAWARVTGERPPAPSDAGEPAGDTTRETPITPEIEARLGVSAPLHAGQDPVFAAAAVFESLESEGLLEGTGITRPSQLVPHLARVRTQQESDRNLLNDARWLVVAYDTHLDLNDSNSINRVIQNELNPRISWLQEHLTPRAILGLVTPSTHDPLFIRVRLPEIIQEISFNTGLSEDELTAKGVLYPASGGVRVNAETLLSVINSSLTRANTAVGTLQRHDADRVQGRR